ncbi:MAG: hypothetical protein ACK4V2_06000 [Pseudomonadota bacterium]|jgi:hypothetical protein
MKTMKTFCLILAFIFFKASGIDGELQEHLDRIQKTTGQPVTGGEYLAFTLFGGSFTNEERLENLCATRKGCEIRSFKEKLNRSNITAVDDSNPNRDLAKYLVYNNSSDELSILYGTGYSLRNPGSTTHLYAHLISHAFSSASTQKVTIYAPILTEYFGHHVEYLKLECHRSGADIHVFFNIFDSLEYRDRKKDSKRITEPFITGGTDNWFKKLGIRLSPTTIITYHHLSVQSCIGSDCNVFANAFLAIKWLKDIDPQDITDYRSLHKVMQKMIDLGIVLDGADHTSRGLFENIMGLIESTSKYMGTLQRYELDNPSAMWKRIPKLFSYRAIELSMRAIVGTGEFILAMLGLE